MKTIVVSTGLLAFLTILYQLEIKIIIKKVLSGLFRWEAKYIMKSKLNTNVFEPMFMGKTITQKLP